MPHPHTPGEAWLPQVTPATRDAMTASIREGGAEFITGTMLQLQQEQPQLVQMTRAIAEANTAHDDYSEPLKVAMTAALVYAALKNQIAAEQLGQIPTAES